MRCRKLGGGGIEVQAIETLATDDAHDTIRDTVLVRRCKIVCTIGPSSDDPAALEALIRAGMDMARLNFSHGTHEEHAKRFRAVRAASEAVGRPVAILQDLCGPKIRAGKFTGGTRALAIDETVWLCSVTGDAGPMSDGSIPIVYEGLAEDLHPGDAILFDDGRVSVTVTRIQDNRVCSTVTQAGALRDRVGVSLPARRVRLASLTEKDKKDLAFGLDLGVDYVALSFVRHPEDVRMTRALCEAHGKPTPIISKIETPQAIEELEEIIIASDGAMVARGDLGVELSPEQVPVIQREILGLARKHQRPVIVATEMLQSMVTSARPTRAEASDVATAVFDGTDAVMLSAETATGKHPSLVVQMMSRIIVEAEKSRFYVPQSSEIAGERTNIPESIARNACDIARDIGAPVIVAFTESGSTARFASKARPRVPIIAFSPNDVTLRRLALLWGVLPHFLDRILNLDELAERASRFLTESGHVSPGDHFVMVFGAPVGGAGSTNSIRVKAVE